MKEKEGQKRKKEEKKMLPAWTGPVPLAGETRREWKSEGQDALFVWRFPYPLVFGGGRELRLGINRERKAAVYVKIFIQF